MIPVVDVGMLVTAKLSPPLAKGVTAFSVMIPPVAFDDGDESPTVSLYGADTTQTRKPPMADVQQATYKVTRIHGRASDFGSGALTLVSQTDASSGSLVSYVGGIFTARFWTTGHPVPFLVSELDAEDVQAPRDDLDEQLEGRSTGQSGPCWGARRASRASPTSRHCRQAIRRRCAMPSCAR